MSPVWTTPSCLFLFNSLTHSKAFVERNKEVFNNNGKTFSGFLTFFFSSEYCHNVYGSHSAVCALTIKILLAFFSRVCGHKSFVSLPIFPRHGGLLNVRSNFLNKLLSFEDKTILFLLKKGLHTARGESTAMKNLC